MRLFLIFKMELKKEAGLHEPEVTSFERPVLQYSGSLLIKLPLGHEILILFMKWSCLQGFQNFKKMTKHFFVSLGK